VREALFRAAQQGGFFTDEETVGRWQDDELTGRVLAGSLVPVPAATGDPETDTPPLVVWPYPRGTMHIIDRANCADHFLTACPDYELVTESDLDRPMDLPSGPTVVFAPFDAILPLVGLDGDGSLTLAGRPITALLNELMLAHLVRHDVLPTQAVTAAGYRPIVTPPRTQLVNGTQLTLFKARQLRHVADLADRLEPLGVAPLPYVSCADRAGTAEAVLALCATGKAVVVRPFGASQGTGVLVVAPDADAATVESELDRLEGTVEGRYGAAGAYPATVTPFVEGRKLQGAVADVRMFVINDRASGGLRALPGMVRRAARPFRAASVTADTVLTNFSGTESRGDLPGPRVFPASRADVLDSLGLTPDRLVDLGRAASLLWATAVDAESAERGAPVPFCYGSVDFLVREDDGQAVPIEMNGANVGEHPTVAVNRLGLFAAATTAVLGDLGLRGGPAPLATDLRYIDGEEVAAALATVDPVARIRDVLTLHAKGETELAEEARLHWTGPDGSACRTLNMPGLVRDRDGDDTVGTKIINASVGNLDRGLPRAAGLTMLFDPLTGRPRTMLDGTDISALRTAAVTMCAIEELAVRTGVLAVIGAGPLAAAHLRLMVQRLPDLTEVRLFDREPERAAGLAASVEADVRIAASAEEAVRGADVVVPVTTTTVGYIPMDWLAGCGRGERVAGRRAARRGARRRAGGRRRLGPGRRRRPPAGRPDAAPGRGVRPARPGAGRHGPAGPPDRRRAGRDPARRPPGPDQPG
jgi:hypothetical protein